MTDVRLRTYASALVGLTGIGPVTVAPTRNLASIASITAFVRGDPGPPGTGGGGGGITDGDKGDIVVSGAGTVWTVENGVITLVKLADMASGALIGRQTAGAGSPEALTAAQVRTLLNVADGATANQTDAYLRNRNNHTNTQLASTISDFSTAADARVAVHVGLADPHTQYQLETEKGAANGYPSLDGTGKIPTSQLPALALTDVYTVVSQVAQLALVAQEGDVAIRTDLNKSYVHNGGAAGTMADWSELLTPTDSVLTVAGRTGAVVLSSADVTNFDAAVAANSAVALNTAKVSNATHTGDVTGSTALTLATVNGNVGSFGSASAVAQFVVNAKGLITSVVNTVISIASTAITDFAAATRGQTESALIAGTNVTITPSGTGATRQLTITATGGGGAGSPGGSTSQVQYNNAGVFAGATEVEIEGNQLRLDDAGTFTAPASGGVKLVAMPAAAGSLPAYITKDGRANRLQRRIGDGAIIQWFGAHGSNALTVFGGAAPTLTGTGTIKSFAPATAYGEYPFHHILVTVAAVNAVAGFHRANANLLTSIVGGPAANRGGFDFSAVWGMASGGVNPTHRAFCGLAASVAAPTDVEPSTQINCVGMGWDAADANVQIMHNDGTGTCTKINLGINFPVQTTDQKAVYALELYSPKGTTQSVDYRVTERISGAVATGTITTNLPGTATALGPRGYCSAGGTSSIIGFGLSALVIDPLL